MFCANESECVRVNSHETVQFITRIHIHGDTRLHRVSDKSFMTFISPQINTSTLGSLSAHIIYDIRYFMWLNFSGIQNECSGSWFHWLCILKCILAFAIVDVDILHVQDSDIFIYESDVIQPKLVSIRNSSTKMDESLIH